MSQQISSFNHLFFKGLKAEGYYIIEDLHTSYISSFMDHLETTIDFISNLIDCLHIKGKRNPIDIESMNAFERHIESISFYSSMCIIRKK